MVGSQRRLENVLVYTWYLLTRFCFGDGVSCGWRWTVRYRIAYRIDGKLEYMYFEYMKQVDGALRGVIPATNDYRIEVLGTDGKYHSCSAWSPK